MIDAVFIPPFVHVFVGMSVLATTLTAALWCSLRALRKLASDRVGRALLLLAQATVMVQALIGIKLLDQGLGPAQLYIHYLGGLAPLLFLVLTYWFPASAPATQTRNQAIAAVCAFAFAFMSYTIGQAYVNRELG